MCYKAGEEEEYDDGESDKYGEAVASNKRIYVRKKQNYFREIGRMRKWWTIVRSLDMGGNKRG